MNKKIAVLIRVYDRTEDLKLNVQIIKDLWNDHEYDIFVCFNGKEKGQLAFSSSFATDLTQYNKANSTLELTVRLTEQQSFSEQQGIYLSMECGEQCQGKVNIAKELSSLKLNQWQTLNIDLQCFEKDGADMSQIISPFALSTSAKLNIDFTDVFIKPNSADTANISCH
mgnify:CR=1 FL=1